MIQNFPDFPISGFRGENFSINLDDELVHILADIRPQDRPWLKFELLNGVTALDQFIISTRTIDSGTFDIFYQSSTDYTTLEGPLQGTSGDLTALIASVKGWFWMYTVPFETIRIEIARAAGGNSVVAAAAGLGRIK